MPYVDIRLITVGHIHALPGDPHKVVAMHHWLINNPHDDLPALDVRLKPNGTYRIHDGRHRYVAAVLAQRPTIPVIVSEPDTTASPSTTAAERPSERYSTTTDHANTTSPDRKPVS